MTKKRRVLALIIASVVVALAFGLYFFVRRVVAPSGVLKSDVINAELAKGKCSDQTIAKLGVASNSSDAATKAKLYENQGLCFVYSKQYEKAIKAYKLAKDAYIKAGLKDAADKLDGPIEGLEAITRPMPENGPADGAEPVGGT